MRPLPNRSTTRTRPTLSLHYRRLHLHRPRARPSLSPLSSSYVIQIAICIFGALLTPVYRQTKRIQTFKLPFH